METDACDALIPLSAARNRLLSRLDLERAGPADVVAFPDDDAWYADGALDRMRRLIADDDAVGLAFCRFGSRTAELDEAPPPRDAGLQSVLSHASSATIFLRASLAARIGRFDEGLGLGTPAVSGEDTDYAMRAWRAAARSVFVDAALVGHEDSVAATRHRYYAGGLRAIALNAGDSPAGVSALARKLAIGALYVASGRLGAGAYVRCVRHAFSGARGTAPPLPASRQRGPGLALRSGEQRRHRLARRARTEALGVGGDAGAQGPRRLVVRRQLDHPRPRRQAPRPRPRRAGRARRESRAPRRASSRTAARTRRSRAS